MVNFAFVSHKKKVQFKYYPHNQMYIDKMIIAYVISEHNNNEDIIRVIISLDHVCTSQAQAESELCVISRKISQKLQKKKTIWAGLTNIWQQARSLLCPNNASLLAVIELYMIWIITHNNNIKKRHIEATRNKILHLTKLRNVYFIVKILFLLSFFTTYIKGQIMCN